ncbi:hypothetical protein [Algoriphagus antarcticus]|uniref:Uncharacterized protein n=1 Tax=Algoriphagus antarcticus TaxID=238540 RepID=A0A3E0E8A9_9BACT|nr:hypothetical protein [Algoriphagus antarcticus]REG94451.1 hypothetical protein C8N25_101278 [Algoriphagus antarcticus]
MIKKIQKSIAVKVIAILLLLNFNVATLLASGFDKVILTAGSVISLENPTEINSENLLVGQSIDFIVQSDVKVDGKVVVNRGSIANGVVTRVQKAKGLGKEGSLEIEIKSVQAVDGTEIRLTSTKVSEVGEDKQTTAILLGVFICILFLTKKGKNAVVPNGFTIDGRVASNVEITV